MRFALVSLAAMLAACSASSDPGSTDPESTEGAEGGSAPGGTGGSASALGGSGGVGNPTGGSGSTGGAAAKGGSAGAGGTIANGGAGGSAGASNGGGGSGGGGNVGPAPNYKPGVWTNITPSIIPATSNTYCVTVDQKNPDNIYFCATNPDVSLGAIFKSKDAGKTWTKLPTIDTPLHVLVDPNDSDHLYAVDGVWGNTAGFWVSTNGGASWNQPDGFLSATAKLSRDTYDIAADPSDFQHIVLSFHSPWAGDVGPGVLESTDGGKSFTPHTVVNGGAGHSIHFLHEPKLGIGDAKTWLLGTQGKGFWRTTDAGVSWTKVSDGQITHGGNFVCYSSKGVLYSGGYTYISRSTDNGATWSLVKDGLPYNWYMGVLCDGVNLWTHPVDGGTFYISPDDNGTTWKPYDGGTQKGFASGTFWGAFDAKRRILYAAPGGSHIHELWALKLL